MDKAKLQKDIDDMRAKLASMEAELGKPTATKHFPSPGDTYWYYKPVGHIRMETALEYTSEPVRVNAYRTKEEAKKAYNQALATEKLKRIAAELNEGWEPNFKDYRNKNYFICYVHSTKAFEVIWNANTQINNAIYFKTADIAHAVIKIYPQLLKEMFGIED